MKKFGELKKVESKPNFNLESKMSRSDTVVRQKNKGRFSRQKFRESWPTLSIRKEYGNRLAFDCDLCRGQFYLRKVDIKGCPSCKTHYTYLVYLTKYDCYKVGVTTNIYNRLSTLGGGILIFYRYGSQNECAMLEYKWLSNLKDYLVVVEGLGGGTETFKDKE